MLPGPAVLDLPGTSADLPNHDDRACGPNDEVTMTEALTVSCNTAFAQLGMDIGADALQTRPRSSASATPSRVPMRVTPSTVPAEMNKPQLAQASIGQYDVAATPCRWRWSPPGWRTTASSCSPTSCESVIGSDLSVIESAEQELSQAVTPEVADR